MIFVVTSVLANNSHAPCRFDKKSGWVRRPSPAAPWRYLLWSSRMTPPDLLNQARPW